MTVPPPSADWIKAWIGAQRRAIEQWQGGQIAAPEVPPNPFADLFARFAGSASIPQGFSAAGQVPGWWRSFSPAAGAGGSWSLPGLGPLREQQELTQALAAAITDFQRLAAEMASTLAKVHTDTLDLLARRSLEQANAGKPVTDFKALYDLWVECGEATYSKVAAADPYCRLQGELGNAGVRVQELQQQLLERWLKQLDLPTRSELNTLHRRIHDLQKRIDAVGNTAAPSGQQVAGMASAPRRRSRKKATN